MTAKPTGIFAKPSGIFAKPSGIFAKPSGVQAAIAAVALQEYFSIALSLLNLLENSLGCSKPATRLMQAQ
jgi:hypothetical protein